jgi:hypothetical protein
MHAHVSRLLALAAASDTAVKATSPSLRETQIVV